MGRRCLVVIVFLLSCSLCAAQTAKKWTAQEARDKDKALDILKHTYESVQDEAILHYRSRSDLRRPAQVDSKDPDSELFERVGLAGRVQPEAKLRDVVRRYFVDVTAADGEQ